jgi:hypothetical protein
MRLFICALFAVNESVSLDELLRAMPVLASTVL